MAKIRRKVHQHKGLLLFFVAWEAFFFVDGVSVVEAREQKRLVVQSQRAEIARAFGIPAELGTGPRTERVSGLEPARWISGPRSQATRLLHDLAESTAQVVAGPWGAQESPMLAGLTPSVGSGGAVGPLEDSSQEASEGSSRSRGDGESVVGEGQEGPRKDRFVSIPEEGDGELFTTRAPSLAASLGKSQQRDSRTAALPTRQIRGTAKTVPVGRLAPIQPQAVTAAQALPRAPQSAEAKNLAPEIVAFAQSHGNSPAKIFRYLHDHIDFDPKWGADSPPVGTLWEKSGTAWDQAWLLHEVLTAIGVDAHLEWGEVELTPNLLLQITGVDDPVRAGDLLTTAGLPVVLAIEGSQVVSARMPHVWVKAHLAYKIHRGHTNGPGDTWLRMDPSLKTFDRVDGPQLHPAEDFMLADHLNSGTEDSPRTTYETALQERLSQVGAGDLDELKAQRSVHTDNFSFVPGTIRPKVISIAGESMEIPEAFKTRLELEIQDPDGASLSSWSSALASVYGQALEIRWPGATSTDEATLELYGDIFATPPFELEVRPSILLNGTEVSGGSAIGAAEDVRLTAKVTPPADLNGNSGTVQTSTWDLFAGEHGTLGFDWGSTPQEVVDAYVSAAGSATEFLDQEAAKLTAAGATYLQSLAADLDHLSALHHRRAKNLGNAVLAVQRGAVSASPDGSPQAFARGPLALETGSRTLGIFPVNGEGESTVPILELLGSQASVREGEALATVFGGEHVTAVDFLKEAVRQGQTLTRVEAGNLETALAEAILSGEAESAVRFAVENGFVAWISETQLALESGGGGWTTTGYIIEDPETGAGGYFVTYERLVVPLEGLVTFHNISDLQEITAPTPVVASIDAEDIDNWTLATRPAGAGQSTVIATGSGPITHVEVGIFDPTLLLNGMHDLVLTGRDTAGRTVTGRVTVFVDGQMKIGHFTLSFVDLQIPLSGLDLQVVRTYDSRRRNEQGDFGHGWILDIRQGSYRNNRIPGDGWQILTPDGPFALPCSQVSETKSHLTTVRLSDQEVYRFRLSLTNPATLIGGCTAEAVFEWVDGPLPGTTLEILGNNEVFYENSSNRVIDRDTLQPFVPQDVKLVTRDGRIFHLDLSDGVTRIEDLHGNALEITPAGISHSNGRRVDFVRDDQERITEIIDPAGTKNVYSYNLAGDLITHSDRAGAETHFSYRDHYLEDMTNALGIRAVRTEYDSQGRMIRITDAGGKSVGFEHDLAGRREVVTNRLGFIRVVEYDERGNATKEVDELGAVTLRTYDADDNLLTEKDPLGHVTTYSYSASGDLVELRDPLGNVTRFTYNFQGVPETSTDPLGHTITNGFDANGELLWTRNPLGHQTSFSYDSRGQVTNVTDALGQVTRFEYDGDGNITQETDAAGQVSTFTYDGRGNRLTESTTRTQSDGSREILTTTFEYDELDRAVAVIAPDGSVSRTSYDLLGRVISRTDELDRTTSHEYDNRGRLTKTSLPDGTSIQSAFDDEGRETQSIDQLGRITSYTFDSAGRLLSTRLPGPNQATVTHTYDEAGRLATTTDALGSVTSFFYDAAGRRNRVTDALGHETVTAFDAASRVVRVIDAMGQATSYEYDSIGRQTAEVAADRTRIETEHDALGRRIALIDQEGKRTEFAYDPVGRLLTVKDALQQVSSYGYDEVGNLLRETDANGHSSYYEYDSRGRRTARILADGARESFTYLADGNVQSHTSFLGDTKTFLYDSLGRLTERRYAEGTSHRFTYTATGQRETATDHRGGVTTYEYDEQDRPIRKTDPTGHSLSYAYDPAGNRTALTAIIGGQSLTTGYSYDALSRVSNVTDFTGGVYSFDYNANGRRTRLEYPNGVITTWTYDSQNQLVDLVTRNADEVLRSFSYTLAETGHRLQIEENNGVVRAYQYDDLWRLTQDRVTQGPDLVYQEDFQYDAVGNRLRSDLTQPGQPIETHLYTYDSRDRITSVDGEVWRWDAAGRLIFQPGFGDELDRTFTWWTEDRLLGVELSNGTIVGPTYDADGNRVSESWSGTDLSQNLSYVVDDSGSLSRIVAELTGDGSETLYAGVGEVHLSAIRAGSELHYYHQDGLGSVRALTGTTGELSESLDYSAFGKPLAALSQPFGFTGEPLGTAGLGFHRARWLDSANGRFVSMDPFSGFDGQPLSKNTYLYGLGDPLSYRDPSGLFGVGELSIANAVRGIVTEIQVSVGVELLTSGSLDVDGKATKIFQLLAAAAGAVVLIKTLKGLGKLVRESPGVGVGVFRRAWAKAILKTIRRFKGEPPKLHGSGPRGLLDGRNYLEVSSRYKSSRAVRSFQSSRPTDFVFDPKTKRFIMGNGPHGHDSLLNAGTIVRHEDIVGGRIARKDGILTTDEWSGHYGMNWNSENRKAFIKFMKKHDVEIKHAPWKPEG